MIEYIVLIAVVLILSLACFNKFTKKRQRIFTAAYMCAVFSYMFAFSALRVDIGWDYTMYTRGFFQMARSGFETLEYQSWEYGFNLLTKIIAFFTKDAKIYIAVISLICLAGPFYAILRYSKKPWLSVLLYINLYFFYGTMNFLRQGIAISIIMFAYTFLVNRKIIWYMLLVALAACFHITALVMVPVYFLVKFELSLKIPLLYSVLFVWIYISSNSTLDLLAAYFRTDYSQSVFFAGGISFLHIIIPSLVLAAGMSLVLKKDKLNAYLLKQPDKHNNRAYSEVLTLHVNLMYFSYLWIIVMLRHSIFERFSFYTYVFVILYIPELIELADAKIRYNQNKRYNTNVKTEDEDIKGAVIDSNKKQRKIFYAVIISIVVIVTAAYNIYGLAAYDKGPHGVYPYQSWLFGPRAPLGGFFGR